MEIEVEMEGVTSRGRREMCDVSASDLVQARTGQLLTFFGRLTASSRSGTTFWSVDT